MASTGKTATAIRFPAHTHEELRQAAEEYGLPVNWLVVQAVQEFLRDRASADEITFKRQQVVS